MARLALRHVEKNRRHSDELVGAILDWLSETRTPPPALHAG